MDRYYGSLCEKCKNESIKERKRKLKQQDSPHAARNISKQVAKDIIEDAVKHGTASGLRRGDAKGGTKLTGRQVKSILMRYHKGTHTRKRLAAYFGISYGTICDIISRCKTSCAPTDWIGFSS